MDSKLIWFESLYDTYADAIWRYLFAQLGDKERAKELMQDVFMKTWQYVVLGNIIEHEKAFLYRTAHNLFINEIRTDKKTTSFDEDIVEVHAADTDIAERLPLAERTELHDKLALLSESHRTVLVMRYFNGLQVREIAEMLGEQENTISMRIKRAIETLKTLYI